jgi:hypothetical protein
MALVTILPDILVVLTDDQVVDVDRVMNTKVVDIEPIYDREIYLFV